MSRQHYALVNRYHILNENIQEYVNSEVLEGEFVTWIQGPYASRPGKVTKVIWAVEDDKIVISANIRTLNYERNGFIKSRGFTEKRFYILGKDFDRIL